MDGGKQSGKQKRKVNCNGETNQQSFKVDSPSTFIKSNVGVKLARSVDHIDKLVESYNEGFRKQCQDYINKEEKKFEHITSLPKLIDVNKTLNKTQVECIELMGFGSFARLQLDHLDKGMLKWIVERYDADDNSLNINNDYYWVNEKDVQNALGVPATGQTIVLQATCTDGLQKYGNLFTVIDGRIDMKSLTESLK